MREEVRDFTPDEAVLFGHSLETKGDQDNAERLYRSVILIVPDHFLAQFRLGTLLAEKKEYYEALYRLNIACKLQRKNDLALSNRAMVLSVLGHFDEAIIDFERAMQIDPNNHITLGNMGNTLERLGRYEEALKALDKSIAIEPNADVAHQNRGVVLYRLGRIDETIAASTEALRVNPEYHEAQYNRGLAKLFKGDLVGGFEDCEAALKTPHVRKPLFGPFPHPQWDGSDFHGKTLLIAGEQGLGDTIHFMRYLPEVLKRGSSVIVAVHELARPLYRFPGVRLLKDGQTSPPFDLQCPLMSLPYRLGMMDPPPPPMGHEFYANYYDPDLMDRWLNRICSHSGQLRVGLCWSGNGGHRHDADRSIPLAQFKTLLKAEGCRFYGLQKDIRPGDLDHMAGIDNLAPELKSFQDTAAAITFLDLVVTVDTSVAHLAASLHKPTWILLPAFGTDWRWQRKRTDSPWYPTARLIRQAERGQWKPTLNKTVQELNAKSHHLTGEKR